MVTGKIYEVSIQSASINIGLQKGMPYTADRFWSRNFEEAKARVKYFEQACRLRKSKVAFIYSRTAEWELFRKEYDLTKLSVPKLSQGISNADLRRGAQRRLYSRLTSALTWRETLFLASFKPGLKKILDQTKQPLH